MENILNSINLVIHILAAVFFVAAPFYQLRWVKQRSKLGYPIIYPFDRAMENVLGFQARLSFICIIIMIITGFAFPVIRYAFYGQLGDTSNLSLVIFSAKTVLAFIGLTITAHGIWILDPVIQKTFASFSPSEEPADELLNRFWALRTKRKKLCQFCFGLALTIVIITPILRFYK